MSNAYTSHASKSSAKKAVTPVSQAMPGREAEMVVNSTGGFTFALDDFGVVDRFLFLGTESNGYYASAKKQTADAFTKVIACVKKDGLRVVARALEVSLAGRAPKNDPAVVIIALAAVYGNAETQAAAYAALPQIARTGTWLFQFVSILNSLGKWNAAAKRGVASWYTSRSLDSLANQLLKYQSRDGWAHTDVLRLAHVKPVDEVVSNLFRYVVKGEVDLEMAPKLVVDFEALKAATSAKEVLAIISNNNRITWEMVPSQFLANADVMSALLPNMGLTATIRKLGLLSANGVLTPLSEAQKIVVSKLNDMEALASQRIHPLTILQAIKQYSVGHGERGGKTWVANQPVLDALDNAFYGAFASVKANDDAYMIGVDCSGSMTSCMVNGSPNLTAAEVAAVMAMAVARNQPNYLIVGFGRTLRELPISPKMRLDAALNTMNRFGWDGSSTNLSLPFAYAKSRGFHVDRFVSITDNEVNCGTHPAQALRDYRSAKNPKAKNVVIGTSVTQFTVADPKDPMSLDIAGFDSAAPQIIANF